MMKWMTFAGILLCCLTHEHALAEFLKNPGFETAGPALLGSSDASTGKAQIVGAIAEGWSDNTGWADVNLSYSLSADCPHSGNCAQKIEIKHGFVQFAQTVQMPGGYYRASVWLRAETPMWASLGLRQQDAPYTAYAAQPAFIGTQWTRVEARCFAPQKTAAFLLINTTGTGTLFVDDAGLTPATARSVSLKPPTAAVPKTFFGMNINHMHDEGNIPWPAVPLGAYRTWDSGIVWANIEPKKGQFDWTGLDSIKTSPKRRSEACRFC